MEIIMDCRIAIVVPALIFFIPPLASAETAQQTFDKNLKNANEVKDRQEKAADKESMRDKSHDNRIKIDKDTSIGVGDGGVSIRTTKGQ
jgi:hypothetical protein